MSGVLRTLVMKHHVPLSFDYTDEFWGFFLIKKLALFQPFDQLNLSKFTK